jgi:hypothetical protein
MNDGYKAVIIVPHNRKETVQTQLIALGHSRNNIITTSRTDQDFIMSFTNKSSVKITTSLEGIGRQSPVLIIDDIIYSEYIENKDGDTISD